MTHSLTAALSALAVSAAVASPGAAAATTAEEIMGDLVPHRAVYDLALGEAGSGAGVSAADGRLVFEFGGSACEGFSVASRFVTRLVDLEGGSRVTDLRSATFETVEPATYTFRHRTFVNEIEQDPVAGRAERTDGGVAVELDEPDEETARLPETVVFPTRQVAELLAAAARGERIHEEEVFDGSDTGTKVYSTTAVIGPEKPGRGEPGRDLPEALEALPEDIGHRRVSLSYFDLENATGEVLPSYELSFVLHPNGVSRDIVFDYGEFALEGRLVELELGEIPDCE